MSIIQNHRQLETAINQRRINQGLRILWPDYQIYDLLGSGFTVLEILSLATFPPNLLHLNNQEAIGSVFQIMKDYTHIAVKTELKLDEKLEVNTGYTLFLTKRNIAVDFITHKFLRGKYILTLQVAQLNRQFSLWGIQALTQSLRTIGPKYIVKSKTSWILEIELEQSVKSIILFSTKREPCYGKNQNHFDLSRDVIKQSCLKMRSYSSVMDQYLKTQGEESLLSFNSLIPLFPSKNIINSKKLFRRSEQQEQKQTRRLLQTKCKIAQPLESSRVAQQILKLVKIRQVKSEVLQPLNKRQSFTRQFGQHLCQLEQILSNSLNKLDKQQNIQEHCNNSFILGQIKHYSNLEQLQQLNLLQIQPLIISGTTQEYILTDCIYKVGIKSRYQHAFQINRNLWIRLYMLVNKIRGQPLKIILSQILRKILIIQSRQLIKDSEDDLQKMQQLLGQQLHKCVIQALQLHLQNELLFGDILFILMKLQKTQNLIQLFKKYPLANSSLLLADSLCAHIQKLELPTSSQFDLIYEYKFQLDYIIYQATADNRKQASGMNQFRDKIYQIEVYRFVNYSLLVGRSIFYQNRAFKVFIYRQETQLFALIQYLGADQTSKHKNSFRSFDIVIKLTVNLKQYKSNFGWNFNTPSQSVGCRFKTEQQNINNLSVVIFMKPQVVHQCVMNYMSIRYVQLFKFPYEISEMQSKDNLQNQRLSKRRSTFELQNLFFQSTQNTLLQNCYFHKKCEKCQHLFQTQTVFSIDQIDMFSLLLSINYKKQIHALTCLVKFILSNNLISKNASFMKHCLRLTYLPLTDVLDKYNLHRCDQTLTSFLKVLIQLKLKIISCKIPQERAVQKLIFSKKSRTITQLLLHSEKDYSNSLLQYLKGQQLKQIS